MNIVETEQGQYPREKFLKRDDEIMSLPNMVARRVANELNAFKGGQPQRFWKVVPEDYILNNQE